MSFQGPYRARMVVRKIRGNLRGKAVLAILGGLNPKKEDYFGQNP